MAAFGLLVSALVLGPASGAVEAGGPEGQVAAESASPKGQAELADGEPTDGDPERRAERRDPAAALAAAVEGGGVPDEILDEDDEDDEATEEADDPLEGVDLRAVPRLDAPRTRADEIRDYWRRGFHSGVGSFNLVYGGPVRTYTFAGSPLRSRFTLGMSLRVLFHPRVQVSFTIRGQRWETLGPGPTMGAGAIFMELDYGLPLLALPTDWRVRPELVARIGGGAGAVTASFDDVTGENVEFSDLDRLTVGLTAAAEAQLDVRVHDLVYVRAFGGVSRSLYNFGALSFARDLQWFAGVGVGFY
ncbi:MAG: hypothetical protein KC486_18275 [Myxococcales bacterium]|nr:hypothetical protein [Myxococcales bacterium]